MAIEEMVVVVILEILGIIVIVCVFIKYDYSYFPVYYIV